MKISEYQMHTMEEMTGDWNYQKPYRQKSGQTLWWGVDTMTKRLSDRNEVSGVEILTGGFTLALRHGLESGLTADQILSIIELTKETRKIAKRFQTDNLVARTKDILRVMKGEET